MDTYYDSAKGVTITARRARDLLHEHAMTASADWDAFTLEVGDQATYLATDVLDWLGY